MSSTRHKARIEGRFATDLELRRDRKVLEKEFMLWNLLR